MMLKELSAIIALFAILMGCGSTDTVNSKDVNSNTIFQSYNADYNAMTGALSLTAQFRVGGSTGTTLRLSDTSSIQLDGQPMQLFDGDQSKFNYMGTFYEAHTSVASPSPSYMFRWTDEAGQAHENKLTMASVVAVSAPAAGSSISKAQDLKLMFTGPDIVSGETITYFLQTAMQPVKGQSGGTNCYSSLGRSCVIPTAELAKLPTGAANISMRRYYYDAAGTVNGGSGKGSIKSTFNSKQIQVSLSN